MRLVPGQRPMVKTAIGKGAAQPFMKEQEQQSDVEALGCQPVSVALILALE